MSFALGAAALAAGYRLAAFDTIGSTNDEALARARAGESGPAWFVSDRQTSGRGRRGRDWHTQKGNLAASLLLTGPIAPGMAATLGFVAGLALSDALAQVAPQVGAATALDAAAGPGGARLALKWPNDVVADGAKLAGIMLESELLPGDGHAVVIGVGVNVVAAPAGVPYPATCLADLGSGVTAPVLFAALSDAWVARHMQWAEGRGLAAIRDAWMARAAGIGGPVAVRIGGRVLRGTFETLDDDGCLVVRDGDGNRVPVAAGEVHFGTVASLGAAG